MPRLILGSGDTPADLMFIGERPGADEYEHLVDTGESRPFIGPAGRELWRRALLVADIRRDDAYTTNLVKTFSPKPPTDEEIADGWLLLLSEILRCRPRVIVTVGYHAARALLPQFVGVPGERFHGLAFPFTYGKVVTRTATVVPIVHSSAALRQPDLYSNQLSADLAAVRRVLDGTQSHHTTHRPQVFDIGLAAFGKEGLTLGLDTEGSAAHPEAVTLALDDRYVYCGEVFDRPPSRFLGAAIRHAGRLYMHSLPADWAVLDALGINLNDTDAIIDDPMLMAYLLGLPQSLKTLAYREFGVDMSEYLDLVNPLDDALVRASLEKLYGEVTQDRARVAAEKKRLKADAAAARKAARAAARAAAADDARASRQGRRDATRSRHGTSSTRRAVREPAPVRENRIPAASLPLDAGPRFPARAYASLTALLHGRESDDSLRARWQRSAFASLATLPPRPTWRDVPPDIRRPYAMTDAAMHRMVGEGLRARIKAEGLSQVYAIDRAALPFLIRNEHVGMACHTHELRDLSARFDREFADICATLEDLVGHPVNPNAHEEVAATLFAELGVTPTRPTPSKKHYTTQDKYLKARRREHEAIDLILDARQVWKMKSTYADKLPTMLRDGRYHPDWRYTRTKSGRLAETIIILIPKHSARGKAIRNCFHATDGHMLLSVDLSQIEMRAMAHLSRDKELLGVYRRGEDVHAHTAHTVLGAPKRKEDQDESLHRLPSKTFNFAIVNGSTEFGILDQLHEHGLLHWTIEGVKEFLDGWFRVHKGVAEYWERQKAFVRRHGYAKDLFGRKSYMQKIYSDDERTVRAAERESLFPIQSTADGISKIWNAKVWKRVVLPRIREGRRYCEPWVRTHDDTMLEVDSRVVRTVRQEVLALVPDLLCVPTTAEAKMGERWGSLH